MITITGIALIGIGAYLALKMEGRAFNRRNAAGIETFDSYRQSLKIRAKEGVVKILAGIVLIVGIVLAVGGLFA